MQDPKPRRRFQFSLRTFLIVVCILGVGGGLLGRLLLRYPVSLRMVLSLLTSVVPFLLAVVTIVVLGVRRRSVWSVPSCTECGHDLRRSHPNRLGKCPGCDADLGRPGPVSFVGSPARRWGLAAWAGALLLMPILGSVVTLIVARFGGLSANSLGLVSTRQLLTQRLPNEIDQPWVWNELDRRLLAGSLSQQEVDAAVKTLTAHVTKTRWQGRSHEFLKSARQAGKISEPVLIDLCDAFYGRNPVISPLSRLREGKSQFDIMIRCGGVLSSSGIGVQLLWQVDRVLLDGQPVEVAWGFKSGGSWPGRCQGNLPAGDHKVTAELECAYLDQSKLIGLNPRDLPADRWPAALKRWKPSVSAPLRIYTADEQIVPLSTDPSLDPRRTGGLTVERFVVQADRDERKNVIVQFAFDHSLAIPLSFDVSAMLGDQTVKLGRIWAVNSRDTSANRLSCSFETLDPSIRRADIILTPNPRHIEFRPEVSEIWGEKIVVEQAPIERLDLETTAADDTNQKQPRTQ